MIDDVSRPLRLNVDEASDFECPACLFLLPFPPLPPCASLLFFFFNL